MNPIQIHTHHYYFGQAGWTGGGCDRNKGKKNGGDGVWSNQTIVLSAGQKFPISHSQLCCSWEWLMRG